MIRPVLFTDLKEIEAIEKDSFIDPWNIKMLSDAFLANGFIGFSAVENGEVIGYIFGKTVLTESEIELIAVKKERRKKGIGRALLTEFLSAVSSAFVTDVFLEVRRSNEAAQSLYEKCGFTYVAVREKYYGGKEDALIMKKHIKAGV